jgi:hypothetical protein
VRKIAALIFELSLVTSALAVCSAPQPRLVCAEYFSSQVVIQAKLVRSKYVAPSNDVDGHLHQMQTEKVLRGGIGTSFQIWEENSSGRATFPWRTGRSYLLFLLSKGNRGWVLDGCGNSGPLEKKQLEVREIEALQKRHGGMIQVVVGGDWIAWSPAMPGVEVNAQGAQGNFSATTDDKGIAEIHAPAGQYSVTVENLPVEPYDFNYDDPRKVVIQNGGCAQIQFVKAQNSSR